MTWFKVDDSFHAHPKVLATDPAALGLWVLAGAWSSAHLTEGFVPDHALPRLLPGSDNLARKLVTVGLWRRARGGFQFHDWTDYNPTASDVRSLREKRAAAGRAGGLASGKVRTKPVSNGEANASARALRVVEPPTRPVPKGRGGTGKSPKGTSVTRASPEPPPRCEEHLDDPDPPPCGRCADARRTREQRDRDQVLADQQRRSREARAQAEANAAAIARCQLCDDRGYLPSKRQCTHDPARANGSGAGAARAAIAGKGRPPIRERPDDAVAEAMARRAAARDAHHPEETDAR